LKTAIPNHPIKLYTEGWDNYELIDAGGGRKLERWGAIITIRPEVQAYFKAAKAKDEWQQLADWEFIASSNHSGVWRALNKNAPKQWTIQYKRLHFQLQLTKFKHLGLFPEQRSNWDFIHNRLVEGDKFLNLFAYSGAASCVARSAGAETLHVDSVKQLISWAKANMQLSHLTDIKWVHEDALKFAAREVKRNKLYKGIVMDPPAWGIGANNEQWKLEDKLEDLIKNTSLLIGNDGFLILNTYSPKVNLSVIGQMANHYFANRSIELNELWMRTSTRKELYYGNLLRVF